MNQRFNGTLLFISIAAAIIIPLLWTALCLPITYWFGFRFAQMMGFLEIVPIVYLIKYFEDSSDLVSLTETISVYILVSFMISIILFIFSYAVSVSGYLRKK
nr:ABC-2 transporter permease [Anaerostipes sp.]